MKIPGFRFFFKFVFCFVCVVRVDAGICKVKLRNEQEVDLSSIPTQTIMCGSSTLVFNLCEDLSSSSCPSTSSVGPGNACYKSSAGGFTHIGGVSGFSHDPEGDVLDYGIGYTLTYEGVTQKRLVGPQTYKFSSNNLEVRMNCIDGEDLITCEGIDSPWDVVYKVKMKAKGACPPSPPTSSPSHIYMTIGIVLVLLCAVCVSCLCLGVIGVFLILLYMRRKDPLRYSKVEEEEGELSDLPEEEKGEENDHGEEIEPYEQTNEEMVETVQESGDRTGGIVDEEVVL